MMASCSQLRTQLLGANAADVLLVGCSTDRFLGGIQDACARLGACAIQLSLIEFAKAITIHRKGPSTIRVTPDLPLVLRRGSATSSVGPDTKFLESEWAAQIWAATALMRSPVLNRPGHTYWPDVDSQALRIRLEAQSANFSHALLPELHVSRLEHTPIDIEFVQIGSRHYPTSTDLDWQNQPLRYRRRLRPDEVYMYCFIVKRRAWIRNESYGTLDWIKVESIRIAESLGLDFCSILWRVAPKASRATIARISSHPEAAVIGSFLDVVSTAIAEYLLT